MMNFIFVLAVVVIILFLCVICAAAGYLIGAKATPKPKKTTAATVQDPTLGQIRAAQRAQREYNNFLNYDGSVQDDFDI